MVPDPTSNLKSSTSASGILELPLDLFLIVVLVVSCLAQCAELPLGKYRKRT